MSSTTIYFLTKNAQSIEEAENLVSSYLDTENFFDYFSVIHDKSGSLAEKRNELIDFIKDWDWKKKADEFYNLAQRYKADSSLSQFGFYLVEAGQLYAQYLNIDTYVFNIDSGDYFIPESDNGWRVIAVDFHY